jgi:hypothetical protein
VPRRGLRQGSIVYITIFMVFGANTLFMPVLQSQKYRKLSGIKKKRTSTDFGSFVLTFSYDDPASRFQHRRRSLLYIFRHWKRKFIGDLKAGIFLVLEKKKSLIK